MKRILAMVLAVVLLSGCGSADTEMKTAMELREMLLSTQSCSFDTEINADFGDKLYSFSMKCEFDRDGSMTFTVIAPETIAGITGSVSYAGGKLTFDKSALAFSLLADGEVSPVSAPWLVMKALRGGYLTACGAEGDLLRLTIDDSYEEDAMQSDIWIKGHTPQYAEVVWQGRRILTLSIENFQLL